MIIITVRQEKVRDARIKTIRSRLRLREIIILRIIIIVIGVTATITVDQILPMTMEEAVNAAVRTTTAGHSVHLRAVVDLVVEVAEAIQVVVAVADAQEVDNNLLKS